MSYILYRSEVSQLSDKLALLLDEQGVTYISTNTNKLQFTKQQVQDLLEMLGLWAIDLVEKSHPLWIDGCLNEESDDALIIEYIVEYPVVIRDAIVIKDQSRAIIANPPENIFSLF